MKQTKRSDEKIESNVWMSEQQIQDKIIHRKNELQCIIRLKINPLTNRYNLTSIKLNKNQQQMSKQVLEASQKIVQKLNIVCNFSSQTLNNILKQYQQKAQISQKNEALNNQSSQFKKQQVQLEQQQGDKSEFSQFECTWSYSQSQQAKKKLQNLFNLNQSKIQPEQEYDQQESLINIEGFKRQYKQKQTVDNIIFGQRLVDFFSKQKLNSYIKYQSHYLRVTFPKTGPSGKDDLYTSLRFILKQQKQYQIMGVQSQLNAKKSMMIARSYENINNRQKEYNFKVFQRLAQKVRLILNNQNTRNKLEKIMEHFHDSRQIPIKKQVLQIAGPRTYLFGVVKQLSRQILIAKEQLQIQQSD